eukprot:15470101-Alexandrium_andersonii.AAC.1
MHVLQHHASRAAVSVYDRMLACGGESRCTARDTSGPSALRRPVREPEGGGGGGGGGRRRRRRQDPQN